jgi:hypothetical protein
VKLTRKREHERDGVFRHCPFIGALSTGQPNAALHERRLVKLIRASAERLHKTKLRRACQKRVAPQARYDEHVGLMRPTLQLFQRAHLKVRDTGSPRGQFLRPANSSAPR